MTTNFINLLGDCKFFLLLKRFKIDVGGKLKLATEMFKVPKSL